MHGFCVGCIFLTKRQQEIFFKCPACHYHPSDDGEMKGNDVSPYIVVFFIFIDALLLIDYVL